jgi:MFS family permease
LYPYLPLNNTMVGVPVVWVGVLLSINRFVRIFSNGFMVHLFAKHGLRIVMIFAVIAAVASTAGYAVAGTVWVWLCFRICWGLAFSALRIGPVGYALQQPEKGFAFGLTRSLQEAGPVAALLVSPLLLEKFTPDQIFLVLAGFSLPAIFFAWQLPVTEDKTEAIHSAKLLQFPSILNSITLLSAIVIDGIIVVVLGILFLHYDSNLTLMSATALAAFYLGYRRVCLVLLSPAGGWIADRIGLDRVFVISIGLVIAGLVVLILGWVEIGAVMVFTFYGVNAAITPGSVVQGKSHSLAAIAENATWRDIGAALGTLIGGFLITLKALPIILLIGIVALIVLLIVYIGTAGSPRPSYLWK